MKKTKHYPKNYFFNIGLILGIPFTIIAGIAFGNMAFGPITGMSAGMIVGFILERYYNPEPIEPDPEALARFRKNAWYMVIAGIVVLATVLTIYLAQVS